MLYECLECGETSNHALGGELIHKGRKIEICANCDQCGITNMIHVAVHPPRNDNYRDRGWLNAEYTVQKRTMSEIADACGVSAMTIYQWLKKHEIPTRRRGRGERL